MFDEYEDFCAGSSKPAMIYNPDKVMRQAIHKEINGHEYFHFNTNERKELRQKYKEQNEIL